MGDVRFFLATCIMRPLQPVVNWWDHKMVPRMYQLEDHDWNFMGERIRCRNCGEYANMFTLLRIWWSLRKIRKRV
ncbi:hypothetical protein BH789_gp086 [Gordonia phage GMA6]|uniref:Uncharacterized protein n=1 Tax=Gordonia phage GMA6 TaxID=1647285 RepID=A0A0K0NLD7_9CAUD|nr:hypothetical protein BH789_gp086 [Gordonia phage GMA6]AKL88367.1 hypothetical protein GMA6_86 [Gordonia phage GMA6]